MFFVTMIIVMFGLLLTPADAGEPQKQYFTATVPGSWVTVEATYDTGGKNVYTYSRLDDNQGRAVIEFEVDVTAGPGAGTSTTQLYVIEEGFELTKDALSYMKALQAMVVLSGDYVSVSPPTVIDAIRAGARDFSNALTFEQTEKVGQIECDRYAYRVETGGPHPTVTQGSLWLSNRVPFGVVKQTGTTMDADGAPLSSYEQLYVDSGSGAVGTRQLLAEIAGSSPQLQASAGSGSSAPVAQAFATAYDAGVVRLLVEADAAAKGRRLQLSIVNESDEPVRVSISTDEVHLKADTPVNTLKIAAIEAQELELAPGETSPSISFQQTGDRGVVEGEFSLIVYEGTPLYQGSVTIGSL